MSELQDVAQERTIRLGVGAVDDRVGADEHGLGSSWVSPKSLLRSRRVMEGLSIGCGTGNHLQNRGFPEAEPSPTCLKFHRVSNHGLRGAWSRYLHLRSSYLRSWRFDVRGDQESPPREP